MKDIHSLVALCLIALSSCQSSEPTDLKSTEFNMLDFIAKNATLNAENMDEITLSAVNIHGKIAQVNLQKEFKNNVTGKVHFSETMRLEGSETMKVIPYTDQVTMDDVMATFGKKMKISIERSSANAKTELADAEVYNPLLIEITNKDELLSISLAEDMTIRWNKDEVNDKPITISLIGRSNNVSGDQLKDVDFTKLVADTGSFTISRSELQIFSSNMSLDIVIARGNQEVSDNTVLTMYNSDLVSSRVE